MMNWRKLGVVCEVLNPTYSTTAPHPKCGAVVEMTRDDENVFRIVGSAQVPVKEL